MSSEKFERPCNGQTVDGSPMATHCIGWDMDSDGQGAISGSFQNGVPRPRRRDNGFDNRVPPCCRHSPVIIESFTLISSAEERLDSSWQSSGVVVPCFADVASPAPSSARPLD